jgi:GT2 family glycosyltransferase
VDVVAFELLRYLKDRFSKSEFVLSNLVDMSSHHSPEKTSTPRKPKISIIVPTRDKPGLLRNCLESVKKTTADLDIELVIVDNDSIELESKKFFEELQSQGAVILKYPGAFNYSAISNLAARNATGEFLCFLNNDTEAITQQWLTSMVEHASQPTVGLVGAVLLYPDKTLQHMGISLGMAGGIAGHPYRGKSAQEYLPEQCFEVSGVTFACAVISKTKFDALGGLDEQFPVGFNDVDISVRSIDSGLHTVVCTKSVLTHAESQSRPKGKSLKGIISSLREVITFLRVHPNNHSDRFFQRRVSS